LMKLLFDVGGPLMKNVDWRYSSSFLQCLMIELR
jgi:hypothetical protein